MIGMFFAGVWPRRHASQAHKPHETLHPLAVNLDALTEQMTHHATATVERILGVRLVNQTAQVQVCFSDGLDRLAVVPSSPANAC